MTGGFRDLLSDGTSLAAMLVGGLGYRLGRVGTMAFGTSHGIRALSVGVGMVTEVSAYELAHRGLISVVGARSPRPQFVSNRTGGETRPLHPETNLWSWNGPGGLRQGLLSSLITFGTLRGAGHLARAENLVVRHLLQDSGMVLGHQAAGMLGVTPRPVGSLAEQFLHAEATNLQMGAAMTLGHSFMGGNVQALERGLDLSLHATDVGANLAFARNGIHDGRTQGSPLQNRFQPALAVPSTSMTESPIDPALSRPLSMASLPPSSGEIPFVSAGPEISDLSRLHQLQRRFYPIFSENVPGHYAAEILETVLMTPFRHPHFHEEILTTLAERSDRGRLEQLFLARALYEALVSEPLHYPTRSYSEALIHTLCSQTFSRPSRIARRSFLHRLFNTMEQGSNLEGLEALAAQWGGRPAEATPVNSRESFLRHSLQASLDWRSFTQDEQTLLLNTVDRLSAGSSQRADRVISLVAKASENGNYSMEDIRRVLSSAREHPLGRLKLERLLQILAVEDIPEKIRELTHEIVPPAFTLWEGFDREGYDLEERARLINGSAYTAHFDDLRLARKVVSVLGEVYRLSVQAPRERNEASRRFFRAYDAWVQSEEPLNTQTLIELVQANPSEQTRSLVESYRRGAFRIVFLSGEELDRRNGQLGRSRHSMGLFQPALRPGGMDQIFLREMPEIDTRTTAGNDAAFAELSFRLKSLVHEWEHWRHMTGHYDGSERNSEPIEISRIQRRERLISEIMAYLEEYRWRYLNMKEDDLAQVAFRLGLTLPQFLRNFADHFYFSRTNEQLMKTL